MSYAFHTDTGSSLVPLRSAGSKNPLFLIHGVDGDVVRFAQLANHLALDRPIYGIRAQAFARDARALTRIEDQAALYAGEIRRVQPHGPYHLAGFSFGGLVALEIAQLFHAQGQECGLLGVVDNLRMGSGRTEAPTVESVAGEPAAANQSPSRKAPLAGHLSKVFRSGGIAYAWEKVAGRGLRFTYTVLDRIGLPIPGIIRHPYDINWFAAVHYVPRIYPGRVTLFLSASSAEQGKSTKDMWQALAQGGIETRRVSGTHETLFFEPNVIHLAQAIESSVAGFD